jgi:putative lipoprotein (rSAM/lipoprotein system)
MKSIVIRFCRWALPFFGISSIVSCERSLNISVAYGLPPVEFAVKGKVVDEDFNPIENIEVTFENCNKETTTRTSAEGIFATQGKLTGSRDKGLIIHLVDTDGKENGGEFQEEVVKISINENDELITNSFVAVLEKKQ